PPAVPRDRRSAGPSPNDGNGMQPRLSDECRDRSILTGRWCESETSDAVQGSRVAGHRSARGGQIPGARPPIRWAQAVGGSVMRTMRSAFLAGILCWLSAAAPGVPGMVTTVQAASISPLAPSFSNFEHFGGRVDDPDQ